MPVYFAYGSNMDTSAMAARCPASRQLGPARLAGRRFVISREGYASVVRDPRHTVWGLLWDIAFADMPALDRYESVASGLYVKLNQPVLAAYGSRRALIYVARSGGTGQPRPGYLEGVVAAARAAALPEAYIREIEAWSPQIAATRQAPAGAAEPRPVRPLWSSPRARDQG
ncbi:MAG TPA: gamma-glutamylcyclotransferase family protein [Beijerinckiaceae bacterium]|nr:gamma-glutamylcyclotransferase family protein [Beijerinckiaceae bacterium]